MKNRAFTFLIMIASVISCQKQPVTNCFPEVDKHYSDQEYKNLVETPPSDRRKYFITESSKNGRNNTDFEISRGGHIVFYEMGKEIYMADISGKCDQQTYGKIDQMITASSKFAKFPTSTFRWKYQSTYDNKTGTAMVKFHKYYESGEMKFTMQILSSDSNTIIYKGFVSIY
ncbi:hypothetical protein [Elizabethkingia anophelis]|uniref:Lipoprotein n=2 Tax=Elizabethkingia anophelis TaxID=1117645 RepID=A0A455ZFS8_9FLAO|nr:hypothetical protein [Elizabethkingia anophelis]MCS7372364.1 hypothetical protein [Elizabethkingia anophelis]MCS7377228.1 hypothetical protein [Elizabethkingia anophelis]MCS7390312.1 hypothetical protein [Elizabethkingia anophelis]DAC75525.1 TPA_exp: hypothetical protein [Elizabethkingia anophelis]